MINTTKDILWLVLSFCILWLTIFICWVIYYLAMILREGKKMVVDFRKKIELLEGVIKAIKEKFEHTSSYVKLMVESIETALHFLKAKREEDTKKHRK